MTRFSNLVKTCKPDFTLCERFLGVQNTAKALATGQPGLSNTELVLNNAG